ncbi:MAG: DUF2182 domain-containing protein, partial [Paracoccaceae bacterium]
MGWLRYDRRIVTGSIALSVDGAAAYILAGGGTGMAPLDMAARTGPLGALLAGTPDMVMPMTWSLGYAAVIFVMWSLMMVAMMVPSAAPTILLYASLHKDRGAGGTLAFFGGYLLVWTGFGLMATAAQAALSAAGQVSAMYMTLATPLLGAVVLIGAGVYQLTPLKQACLASCRGPVEALVRHRRSGRAAALRMGMAHGRDCLGCCWALMALLFIGGVMNIWWILGLSLYVALEKLAPGGDQLARPLGVALILAGVGMLVLVVLR